MFDEIDGQEDAAQPDNESRDDENSVDSLESAEIEAQKREMQVKKLMTVAKSKYFMLKANFPKQAQLMAEAGGDQEPPIL